MHGELHFRSTLRASGLLGDSRVVEEIPANAVAAQGWVIPNNPATLAPIAAVRLDEAASSEKVIPEAVEAFRRWREVPAPVRGQVVRAIGDEFRRHKDVLGELVSLEVGKIR